MPLKRLTGRLPPALRRSLAGAWLDVRSLPQRLRDPSRWDEPLQAVHNVGGGDFDQMGQALLSQLCEFASLRPVSPILDIGCGAGRLAKPLSTFLAPTTAYIGFDVSTRAIDASRRRIGRSHPNFSFVKADILNGEYNPNGSIAEADYVFPARDSSVEVAAAFSVFSHMRRGSIAHYLREARRVLRPGGRLLFTAYALTPERVEALDRGQGEHQFRPWRESSMVIDPRSPERAIAHPLTQLESAVEAAGLQLPQGCRFGAWLGPPDYEGGQDLFVAVKD